MTEKFVLCLNEKTIGNILMVFSPDNDWKVYVLSVECKMLNAFHLVKIALNACQWTEFTGLNSHKIEKQF